MTHVTLGVPSRDSLLAYSHAYLSAWRAHDQAMHLINSLSPNPPQWARDAVAAAYESLGNAEAELDALMDSAAPQNRMEPADEHCHVCGRESSPGERWYVCDTCEACRFAAEVRS